MPPDPISLYSSVRQTYLFHFLGLVAFPVSHYPVLLYFYPGDPWYVLDMTFALYSFSRWRDRIGLRHWRGASASITWLNLVKQRVVTVHVLRISPTETFKTETNVLYWDNISVVCSSPWHSLWMVEGSSVLWNHDCRNRELRHSVLMLGAMGIVCR